MLVALGLRLGYNEHRQAKHMFCLAVKLDRNKVGESEDSCNEPETKGGLLYS